MSLSDSITTLRDGIRSSAVVILAVGAGLCGAQLITALTPPTYQAQASVLVIGGSAVMPTIAGLAESREVAIEAAHDTGLPPGLVIGHVSTDSQPGLQIITLTARADRPDRAAAVANATAHALGVRVAAEPLDASPTGLVTVHTLDNAAPPSTPVTPLPMLNDVIGALLGLLAGLGAFSLRRRFDDALTGPDQIEAELRLPILAAVPEIPRRLSRRGARSVYRRKRIAASIGEACTLLSALAHAAGHHRLLITDVGVRDPAMPSALLALGLAERHDHVTLIDAQVCRSTLSKHFPEAGEHALQHLVDNVAENLPKRLETQPALTVVPARHTEGRDGMSLPRGHGFARLLADATDNSDLVLVHAPAALENADIARLANSTDSAVLVIQAGVTRAADANRAVLLLQRLGSPIAGVLVIGSYSVRRSAPTWHSALDDTETGRTTPPQRGSAVPVGTGRQAIGES
jgi:capsular polysaccharide biosynthesis protein